MLIHGDCIKEMDKLIRDGTTVDCIITDPPYLMEYKTNRRKNNNHKFTKTIKNDNNPLLIKKAIQQSYQLLKTGGHYICFATTIKSTSLNKTLKNISKSKTY